jgi:Tfp pilus assembly protein PilX
MTHPVDARTSARPAVMQKLANKVTATASAVVLREDGVALVMALVVTFTLAISSAAIATLVTSNERASGRDGDTARAFNAAEAGLNNALSVLTQYDASGAQAVGSTLSQTSFSLDNSTGTYSAVKTGSLEWTVSGNGTSPNGSITRHLELKVRAEIATTTTPASAAYQYGFFVAATTGCTTIGGNAPLQVPVFVMNDLCLSGNAAISEPGVGSGSLNVYVGGKYTATSNPAVGTSSRPIGTFTSVGGCVRQSSNVICSTSASSHVYASSYSSTPSALTKPSVDAAGVYASGRWTAPSCSVGSFTFDNDATRNGSLGSIDLLQGNTRPTFDCTVRNPSGTSTVGRLTWNQVTKVLTITGTIFIDGGLNFSGQSQATYTGFGTIYANGSVTTNGQAAICGPPTTVLGSTCVGQWVPSLGTLEIVALGGWPMSGQSEFDVVAYVVGSYSASGGAMVTGPVITDTAILTGNSKFAAVTEPPPGAPGEATVVTTTSWKAVPGSWRQLTG